MCSAENHHLQGHFNGVGWLERWWERWWERWLRLHLHTCYEWALPNFEMCLSNQSFMGMVIHQRGIDCWLSRLQPHADKEGNIFSARVFRQTMAEETSAGGAAGQERQLVDPAEPQDLPECPICSEALEPQQQQLATLLGCGHTLCRRCRVAVARQEELLRCPLCRRTTNLRLDHLDVPITITSPEQGAHSASLLHKLLGCCVDAPPPGR